YESYSRIIQILRKFEETLGAFTLFHRGFDVRGYEYFYAFVDRSQMSSVFIEVRF
ncbi:hypothetical protein BG011_008284, partial [Mortierella polycephala]